MYNGHGDVVDLLNNNTGNGGVTGTTQVVASYYYNAFGVQQAFGGL